MHTDRKRLSVVGIGPGEESQLTGLAVQTLVESDLIVGYTVYVELVREIFPEKEFLATPMMRETERCRAALAAADEGKRVALICSGDAGVYGMASPVLALAKDYPEVSVRVIPGVTAALSGAALLGSPLTGDFAVISLSDRLTPMEHIEKRLRLAARGGFCICLYNPESRSRSGYLARAVRILMEELSGDTVCGAAKNIGREGEVCEVMTLEKLLAYEADMFTTVFIGNENTENIGGSMVTPRGYRDL